MIQNNYTPLENKLIEENIYGYLMQGFSEAEAKNMAKGIIDVAITMSKKQGTYDLPENFGDILLGKAACDDSRLIDLIELIKKLIPLAREDGARDEDILWWWNLHDVERMMLITQDNIARMAMTKSFGNGKLTEWAASEVRKYFPMYYTAGDRNAGEDRALPYELKDRINIYREKRYQNDPENFKKEIESFSSFNAFIRNEIRLGKCSDAEYQTVTKEFNQASIESITEKIDEIISIYKKLKKEGIRDDELIYETLKIYPSLPTLFMIPFYFPRSKEELVERIQESFGRFETHLKNKEYCQNNEHQAFIEWIIAREFLNEQLDDVISNLPNSQGDEDFLKKMAQYDAKSKMIDKKEEEISKKIKKALEKAKISSIKSSKKPREIRAFRTANHRSLDRILPTITKEEFGKKIKSYRNNKERGVLFPSQATLGYMASRIYCENFGKIIEKGIKQKGLNKNEVDQMLDEAEELGINRYEMQIILKALDIKIE